MVTTKICNEFLDTLLSTFKLSDLIGKYVPFVRAYKSNFFTLCPFHREKTPSFCINDEKSVFFCFGCGLGGNGITFLMKLKNISFMEAINFLYVFSGITFKEGIFTNSFKENTSFYYDINMEASLYYQKSLYVPTAKKYLAYLYMRHIKQHTIELFNLGCTQDGWVNLCNYLKRKFNLIDCYKVGVIKKNYIGNYFDFFRERVIFPIKDYLGFIIGFGGRSLNSHNKIKYLNCGTSDIFKKSSILYGLYECLLLNVKLVNLIVVEGYFDVIRLFQSGLTNCVALLGTTLSIEHIEKIFLYTDSIIFCFDGDLPGKNASWESLKKVVCFLTPQRSIGFVILPYGFDPDLYMLKVGYFNYLFEFSSSITFFSFFFSYVTYNFKSVYVKNYNMFLYFSFSLLNKLPDITLKLKVKSILVKFIGYSLKYYEKSRVKQVLVGIKSSFILKISALLLYSNEFILYVDDFFVSKLKELVYHNSNYYFFYKIICNLKKYNCILYINFKDDFIKRKFKLDIFKKLYFIFVTTPKATARNDFVVLLQQLRREFI